MHNEYFDITIAAPNITLINYPPLVDDFIDTIEVYPAASGDSNKVLFSLGTPIDLQLDTFYVSEWGLVGTK